ATVMPGRLERGRQVLATARYPTGQQQYRNRVGIGLGYTAEGILAARTCLNHRHTQPLAMRSAAIAVGHIDEGALGARQDRANTKPGTGVDQVIIGKTEEIFNTSALEYRGTRVRAFH